MCRYDHRPMEFTTPGTLDGSTFVILGQRLAGDGNFYINEGGPAQLAAIPVRAGKRIMPASLKTIRAPASAAQLADRSPGKELDRRPASPKTIRLPASATQLASR